MRNLSGWSLGRAPLFPLARLPTLGRTILTGGTTLLSVGARYFFGGAVLRDFPFAILIGILIGPYSSIFIASPIVLWWSKFRGESIRRRSSRNRGDQSRIAPKAIHSAVFERDLEPASEMR